MSTPSVLNERYQLLESLGNGGMALVYKAKDLMLERNVAVKLLREDYSKDLAFPSCGQPEPPKHRHCARLWFGPGSFVYCDGICARR
jgi:serine/threonine protein kinase